MDNQKAEYVGIAEAMPGTGASITMVVFKADAVPVGTKLYISPQSTAFSKDFETWYTKRYGPVDKGDPWSHAQRADALEIWNAARASLNKAAA